MASKGRQIINLIVGNKVYRTTRKMAMGVIDLAKEKFKDEGVNALVAVEKDDMINLRKDVFEDSQQLEKEIVTWIMAGYECHYYMNKEKEKQNEGM